MAVGEDVPAHVEQHEGITAELSPRLAETGRERGRAMRDVDQENGTSEVTRHLRLREFDSVGAGGAALGQHSRRAAWAPAADLLQGARPWAGVDRRALPGDSAQHPVRAQVLEQLADSEGADHVAAAAHADQEGAPSVFECLKRRT
jgi:hypothetical protein